MTTDPFTEAARAEAERRWPMDALPVRLLSAAERKDRRIGFEVGTAWARTHLAAQEPTDAEAIAYLAAFVEDLNPGEGDEWTPDTIARVKRGLRAARQNKENR